LTFLLIESAFRGRGIIRKSGERFLHDGDVIEATAEYYPKVSLSALLGLESLRTGSLFAAGAFQPQAALGLHWRLFDFGRVDAEVAQAKGKNAEELATYCQSMLRATEDVENAIVTLSELEHQHDVLAKEFDAHERARAAAEDAYKGGAVSLLEVLDEDRQLLASRDELARVHADGASVAGHHAKVAAGRPDFPNGAGCFQ